LPFFFIETQIRQ